MKKLGPLSLREVAKRRLHQLTEQTPEQNREGGRDARRQGCRVMRVPGYSIWIHDFSLDDSESSDPE